jgi:hypothetical protein
MPESTKQRDCRWTFGCVLLLVLAIQIWMVYVKAKENNAPSAAGLQVCVSACVRAFVVGVV